MPDAPHAIADAFPREETDSLLEPLPEGTPHSPAPEAGNATASGVSPSTATLSVAPGVVGEGSDDSALCVNCDAPRVDAYCPRCGQQQTAERLTLRRLWVSFASRVFNVNRGLLATVIELSKHPGQVPLDYVHGKRQRYTNPLTYLFLASALSLAIYQVSSSVLQTQSSVQIERDQTLSDAAPEADTTSGVPHDHDGDGIPDHGPTTGERVREGLEELMANGGERYMERVMEETRQVQRRQQSFLMLLLCVPFTLLVRLLFGPARNLAEISVFSLYVVGHAILILALLIPLLLLSTTATALSPLFYIALAAWAAVRFWDGGWSVAARSAAAMTLALSVYMLFVMLVSIVAVFGSVFSEAGASWGWILSRVVSNLFG